MSSTHKDSPAPDPNLQKPKKSDSTSHPSPITDKPKNPEVSHSGEEMSESDPE